MENACTASVINNKKVCTEVDTVLRRAVVN